MPAPGIPAPDMSGVDSGLQPTLIAMLYLFPGLALVVLLVRFWRKWVDNILGGGMNTQLWLLSYANFLIDDALIAIAWALALGNSVITHQCKAVGSILTSKSLTSTKFVWRYILVITIRMSRIQLLTSFMHSR
jgi:hypothetical protein